MLSISPLVRANSAVVNRNRDNEGAREQQVKELTTLLLTTSMVMRMEREDVDRKQRQSRELREDADCEERRANQQAAMQQHQQLTMAMVASLMAVMGAINPTAAAAVHRTNCSTTTDATSPSSSSGSTAGRYTSHRRIRQRRLAITSS
jgi:hypothetical protein